MSALVCSYKVTSGMYECSGCGHRTAGAVANRICPGRKSGALNDALEDVPAPVSYDEFLNQVSPYDLGDPRPEIRKRAEAKFGFKTEGTRSSRLRGGEKGNRPAKEIRYAVERIAIPIERLGVVIVIDTEESGKTLFQISQGGITIVALDLSKEERTCLLSALGRTEQ